MSVLWKCPKKEVPKSQSSVYVATFSLNSNTLRSSLKLHLTKEKSIEKSYAYIYVTRRNVQVH